MMKKKTYLLHSLGLAALLSVGFAIVLGILVMWCVTVFQSKSNWEYSESIGVYQDGPVIYRCAPLSPQTETLTLDRKKIENLDGKLHAFSATLEGTRKLEHVEFPLHGYERIAALSDGGEPPNYWYFIHDGKREGKGYFVGFNSRSKSFIGYIGQNGLVQALPKQDDWFPFDGRKLGDYEMPGLQPAIRASYEPNVMINSSYGRSYRPVMISGDRLLQIDLHTGVSRELMKSPDMVSLFVSPMPEKFLKNYNWGDGVVLRTGDRVISFDTENKYSDSYVLPEELRKGRFTFHILGKDKAIVERILDSWSRFELVWIDASGKISQRKEVELEGQGKPFRPKQERWAATLSMPSPLGVALWSLVLFPSNIQQPMRAYLDYRDAIGISLPLAILPFLLICIPSAVLAFLCYRRQHRYALPWTLVWVAFVFLLGVPGYFGYRFHRRWAVLDDCPACKKNVPRDRENCSACGTSFPLPERKGIEVFAGCN